MPLAVEKSRIVHKANKKLSKKNNPFCVYVIQAGDCVKVGLSKSPGKRLKQIACLCSEKAEMKWVRRFRYDRTMRDCEMHAHKELEDFCIGGEWFSCTAEQAKQAVNSFDDPYYDNDANRKNKQAIEDFCKEMGWS